MDLWNQVMVVSIGGALGANARYWLSVVLAKWTGPRFPWATFTINITGSFAIGLLAVVLSHRWPHQLWRLFVVVGFLGGYTTFSSFVFESFTLWERGEKGLSLANSVGSVVAGVLAVVLGVALGKSLVGSPGQSEHAVHSEIIERADSVELAPESFLDGKIENG